MNIVSSPIIKIENLNVIRGHTQVLHDINLEVQSGKILAVVGANGAGKSSLLLSISGILPAKNGQIYYSAPNEKTVDLTRFKAKRIVEQGIVHCPEGRQIFSKLSVEENLRIGAHTRSDTKNVSIEIDEAYNLFPVLGERRHLGAGGLSGGEQMMLALSRALMANPKVLLLDEPSLGLAPKITIQILDKLKMINKEKGISIIIVEQNASLALEMADMACVIQEGKVTKVEKARDLKNDNQVIKAYLGDIADE